MKHVRTHIIFTDGDEIIHSAKLKDENYNLEEFEPMNVNEVERKLVEEKRIADNEIGDEEQEDED